MRKFVYKNWRHTYQPATSPFFKLSYFVGRIGLAQMFVGRLGLGLGLVFLVCISPVHTTSEAVCACMFDCDEDRVFLA